LNNVLKYILCNAAYMIVGVISVLRTLDRESISVYRLNISASDSGAPALTSHTLLHLSLLID